MIDESPQAMLRGWAKAYREGPINLRFPSDPHAEFFPFDMEIAADRIDLLERALMGMVRLYGNHQDDFSVKEREEAKRALSTSDRKEES